MATKYDEVTELKFYDVNDVMRITGLKKSKAYEIMAAVNEVCKANGKLVLRGKVNAVTFNMMF